MSVVVTVETLELDVDPGSSRDVVVKIRNNGDFVDKFTITILGDTVGWSSVTPPAVNIYTDTEESVRVSFAPPRKSAPHARRYDYGVFVQSTEHPEDAATEEGAVTVLPFTATTAELVPQTSRGSGRVKHEVGVKNGGNVAIEAQIVASDPDRLLQFETRPDRLALEPGASGIAKVSITPVDTFLNGPPQSRQFGVTIDSSGQESFELRGAVLQSARLPNWLPRAIAGIAVVAIVGGVMAATGTFPPRPAPAPSSSIAVVTPTPSSPPEPTPSPQPTLSEPPPTSGPASPTPTLLPSFSLAQAATSYVTNNFQFVCDQDPCRQQAISGMRLLTTSLEAQYAGGGKVLDAQVFPEDSMPVILEADIPFAWTTNTGLSGLTRRVVIDFKPLMDNQGDVAYSFFLDDSQTPRRFSVPTGLATQVADMLFDSPMIVMPTPTGPIIPPGEWDDLLLDPRVFQPG